MGNWGLMLLAAALCTNASGRADDEPPTRADVIERYLEALGGRERLATCESRRITGHMTLPDGRKARFLDEIRRPNLIRIEVDLGDDRMLVQAHDGKRAWMVMPMFGRWEPQELPADMARHYVEMAELDPPLMDYAAKGHQVELLDRAEIDGRSVHRLKLIRKGAKEGEVTHYFIDAKTFMLVRTEVARAVMGTATVTTTDFADYRAIDGVKLPFDVRQREHGPPEHEYVRTVERVEHNIELPDERFSMAVAQAAAEEAKPPEREVAEIKDDPKGRSLYEQMLAAFRAPRSLSYRARYTLKMGGVQTTECGYRIWLKKPNYFRVEGLKTDGALSGVIIGDGKRLWIHWPDARPFYSNETRAEYALSAKNVYMTEPAPLARHSIGHQVAHLGNGMLMNILDPSTFHGYVDGLQEHIGAITHRGRETVGGVLCEIVEVSLLDGQRIWKIWIAERDHLPRKLSELVRVNVDLEACEEWSDVTLDGEIADEKFVWQPPAGWREWKLPTSESQLLEVGSLAPDFEAKLADDKTVKLSQYRGKVVFLVFWRVG